MISNYLKEYFKEKKLVSIKWKEKQVLVNVRLIYH